MADYADLAAARDAQVDDRLGDSLTYKPAGAAGFTALKGHFYFVDASGGIVSRDTAKGIMRLKIRKQLLIDKLGVLEPSMEDRIMAPLLDAGVYRPLGPKSDPLAPTYWLVDLQKV